MQVTIKPTSLQAHKPTVLLLLHGLSRRRCFKLRWLRPISSYWKHAIECLLTVSNDGLLQARILCWEKSGSCSSVCAAKSTEVSVSQCCFECEVNMLLREGECCNNPDLFGQSSGFNFGNRFRDGLFVANYDPSYNAIRKFRKFFFVRPYPSFLQCWWRLKICRKRLGCRESSSMLLPFYVCSTICLWSVERYPFMYSGEELWISESQCAA